MVAEPGVPFAETIPWFSFSLFCSDRRVYRFGWLKPYPGVCWALGERVRHLFVAAIGQRTTRFCMDLAPFVQSAHTDRAEVAG